MQLSAVLLLLSGASVAEGFQASPATITPRHRPQQLSRLYSSPEDGASKVEATSTESVQRPRIVENHRRSNDPSPLDLMRMMGTSPRRVFLSALTSTFIAFAANFFGITSNLLSTLPESFAEKTGLDSFYPRGDYKRVTVRGDTGQGKCSFVIPKDWVADTSLALAQAQRRAKVLDYSMKSDQMGVLPDAAYGPPGKTDMQGLSNRETNVSVIINAVKDFTLKGTLGSDPKAAAEILLANRPKPTTLISSFEEVRGENKIPIYQFEYTVDRGERAPPLRAISVIAGSLAGDAFVTLTVVSLDKAWTGQADDSLRKIAESFKLLV
eukprot:scaffold2808_cov143-Skeletonema_menzelii.AAC.14